MRSLLLLAMLGSPLAQAQASLEVHSHGLLRLPATAGVLAVQRVHIADHGTLLIPAGLTEIHIDDLYLGREARIAIAPSEQALRLKVAHGEIAAGAQISARGTPGSPAQPARPGRVLDIRLESVVAESLLVDVRGGTGAPGYAGLDGADGEAAGCTWGQAGRGHDGLDGGDGQAGAAGGQVRVAVPANFPADRLQVRLEGGAGGPAGKGGSGGAGGAGKGCWLYSAAGAADGRPGQAGQAGAPGAAGSLSLLRF